MDEKTATKLLSDIQHVRKSAAAEKQSNIYDSAGDLAASVGEGVAGLGKATSDYLKNVGSTRSMPVSSGIDYGKLQEASRKNQGKSRTNQILKAMLLAGAGGAAFRGGLGLARMFKDTKPVANRVVDMDMPIPVTREEDEEKSAEDDLFDRVWGPLGMGSKDNPGATDNTGVGGYIPSLLLGTPLAAYLGWKGMDKIFDTQRKRRTTRQTDKAKEEYEQALLDQYKVGSAKDLPTEKLDHAFDTMEKAALFENVPGQLKGLLATYALLSGPAAYMFVDHKMKKGSKRRVLEKAMQERARRSAMQQPFELYATPRPVELPAEEEEIN